MKEIDLQTWKRKAHYNCFIAYDNPIISATVRLDVTNLVNYCKRTGASYFATFTYIATKCLNGIEDFRLRIKDDRVYLLDDVDPSYIVMTDEEVIVTCRSKMQNDYKSFYADMRKDVESAKKIVDKPQFNDGDRVDVYYITCLPWIDFTTIMNPYDFKDKSASSIPRLAWGKFVSEGDRYKMAMDIAAHHALIDGYPLSKGFNAIQSAIDDLENFLGEFNEG
ncbi:MAG: hypothetical protein E7369_03365 [Clostridiales bacterium]|nr:hypothetical protein [Clostridiales bacterium]